MPDSLHPKPSFLDKRRTNRFQTSQALKCLSDMPSPPSWTEPPLNPLLAMVGELRSSLVRKGNVNLRPLGQEEVGTIGTREGGFCVSERVFNPAVQVWPPAYRSIAETWFVRQARGASALSEDHIFTCPT